MFFIKENLNLIRTIYTQTQKNIVANSESNSNLFENRAKHLQVMTLIGLTSEHLVKIILLKRGFILNTLAFESKFHEGFMHQLKNKNQNYTDGNQIADSYLNAEKDMKITISKTLIKFDYCIKLFNKSNSPDYYSSIKTYELNPKPRNYNGDSYLGYKKIEPVKILRVIQKMPNSYLHLAEAQAEQNGVIWYLFNFLVWLCKKEYPEFFEKETTLDNNDS